MSHSLNHILISLFATTCAFAPPFVTSVIADSESGSEVYEKQIRPYLSKYCFKCHGADQQKADLRLDTLDPDVVGGSNTDMWQEVLDLSNVSEMPPKKAQQPSHEERQSMVDALTVSLRQAMEAKRSTGGRWGMLCRTESVALRDLQAFQDSASGFLIPGCKVAGLHSPDCPPSSAEYWDVLCRLLSLPVEWLA